MSLNLEIHMGARAPLLPTFFQNSLTKIAVSIFLLFIFPLNAFAITPIARTDVVPYQRINYGSTFNFGVIAFSKPGINRVVFSISGQGYSGGNKISNTMALNRRVASAGFDGVWEYFVTISASEFSGNGPITITPTVYDNDGNRRVLETTNLIVEGVSADFNREEAWVDLSRSDGTGTVGDSADPFPNIQSAINATQAANGGDSSGNIIYLVEGEYDIGGISAATSGEWLTITKSSDADRNKVIINRGARSGNGISNIHLKIDGVTLQSLGSGQEILTERYMGNYFVWTNHCRFIGCGRSIANSNPVYFHHRLKTDTDRYYSTDDYTYNVFEAYQANKFVRGAVISTVHNDVFHEYTFVVNAKVDNVTNGSDWVHSDILQQYQNVSTTVPMENTIAYNIYATDVHYQGIMRNNPVELAQNNAFVNVFIEMREPSDTDERGIAQMKAGLNETTEDHLIMWHCSFPYAQMTLGNKLRDSSILGNLFWQLINTQESTSTDYLYNHYMYAFGLTPECAPTSSDIDKSRDCPAFFSVALDTGNDTMSLGDGVIDISNPEASNFGYPITGSDLVDAMPSIYVPADVFGKARDSKPDIGAIEYQTSSGLPNTSAIPGIPPGIEVIPD